jgi:hypothetical protein
MFIMKERDYKLPPLYEVHAVLVKAETLIQIGNNELAILWDTGGLNRRKIYTEDIGSRKLVCDFNSPGARATSYIYCGSSSVEVKNDDTNLSRFRTDWGQNVGAEERGADQLQCIESQDFLIIIR